MEKVLSVRTISGSEVEDSVNSFYVQEGKSHRAGPTDLFFAAYIDDRIVGVCRYCREEETHLLRSMVVHAPLRNQKIGAAILEAFAHYLDEQRLSPTYCIPYAHLGSFYGRVGFEIVAEELSPAFLQDRIKEYRNKTSDAFMIMRRI